MSYGRLDPPMLPKDGRKLRLLVPVRVSDPTKQDERSLEDQRDKIENWLKHLVEHPFELTVLEGRQSGELLDREEYLRLIELVATDQYDGVVAEDLGRIIRRIQAHLFCEHCVDHDTRVIAINDNVDTARSGWQDASIFSAWHHERSNRDTSDRIKRTHRSRFTQGGCLHREVYGYIKPTGAQNDSQMSKDPSAEPIYKEWFRLLEDEANFAEVARWLNGQGVRFPSRYKGRIVVPDGKSVARYTFNTLLKGVRERNRRKSRRVGSGKYVSINAEPNELLQRRVSHLAFFEERYYDRVVAMVKDRNAKYRRTPTGFGDPRRNIPKKSTRFPGQMTDCGICGRNWVWGGHGQTDHLMCNGARLHRCWVGATFDGPLAARKIAEAVFKAFEQLPDFDPAFLHLVNEEANQMDSSRERLQFNLQQQLAETDRIIANLVKFICNGEDSPVLREELKLMESNKLKQQYELSTIAKQPANGIEIPPIEQIKELGRRCLKDLAIHNPEFGRQLRKLIPRIVVSPVRLCDGGSVVLRGKFRLHLSGVLTDPRIRAVLQGPLEKVVVVDLFEPPQRECFRERVVIARHQGKSEREVADKLSLTVTATQRAAALQRKMDELGINDPYLPVLKPLDDCPKRCRHRHADYGFEPLAGVGEL